MYAIGDSMRSYWIIRHGLESNVTSITLSTTLYTTILMNLLVDDWRLKMLFIRYTYLLSVNNIVYM